MKHWTSEIFEYGLSEGKLLHITDVENGLRCECVCPSCEEALVAVNNIRGTKPRPYFRHYSKINCDHKTYNETVVHYMAKQIIEETGYLLVPKIELRLEDNYREYWTDLEPDELPSIENLPSCIGNTQTSVKLQFDRIVIEKKKNQIRPDVQVFIGGKNKVERALIVEVAYSHFVDEEKLKKIKSDGLDAIEIDLSKLDKNSGNEDIYNRMYSDSNHVKWLNNGKLNNAVANKLNQALAVRNYIMDECLATKTYANLRQVYNCPLKKQYDGKRYVLVENQCQRCRHFITLEEDANYHLEMYKYEKEELEEYGEDTSHLLDKYGDKLSHKDGKLLCAGNIKGRLRKKIIEANIYPLNALG
ncbi:MAG: hypothetical protein ACPGU4_14805 [Flavobacteriales bacterium]